MPGAALHSYSYSYLEKRMGEKEVAREVVARSKQQVLEGGVMGKSVEGEEGSVPAEGGSTEKRSDVAAAPATIST